MKNAEQLKSELKSLITSKGRFSNEDDAAHKKRKEAKMLQDMILQVEAGITEESVLKQLKQAREWIKIMNSRYDEVKDGPKRLYDKKWNYTDKNRQIK